MSEGKPGARSAGLSRIWAAESHLWGERSRRLTETRGTGSGSDTGVAIRRQKEWAADTTGSPSQVT